MNEFAQLLLADSITRLVFLPALLCLPLLLMRRASAGTVKAYAFTASLVELAATLYYLGVRCSGGGFTPVADPEFAWISGFGIRYSLGLVGISMPLVVLTALLLPIVFLGSWKGIEKHWRGFTASLLRFHTRARREAAIHRSLRSHSGCRDVFLHELLDALAQALGRRDVRHARPIRTTPVTRSTPPLNGYG